ERAAPPARADRARDREGRDRGREGRGPDAGRILAGGQQDARVIRIVLVGAAGRMGRAVEAAAAGAADLGIAARVDVRANFPAGGGVWTEDAASVLGRGDVVVDFSTPRSAREAAAACAEKGAAMVTGTTGLLAEDTAALQAAALRVPVLQASNFSLGVAAL